MRDLRRGGGLLLLLGGIAVAAPLIATERAWLASGPQGLSSPALRAWLGLALPAQDGVSRTVLHAPIPHEPDSVDLDHSLASPSREHWLGTDVLGRDLAARVVHGARVSLAVGLLAALFALLVGVPVGAAAGYGAGWFDMAASRMMEAVLAVPTLVLALALLTAGPSWLERSPDVLRIAVVLALSGWVPLARYVRGEVLRVRSSAMVEAARAAGGSDLRVIVRHLLPAALAPVLVTAAFAVGAAISAEAALSFLGFGVRPPVPSWGGLLTEAREQIQRGWWLVLFPGAALFLTVIGCNLLGEGMRAWLDPRARRR
ncbi:MAG TPA: ABC transporter permease [Candidatus Polarisedimenticolaceae bacterium]|nr:ABC transporter permease [Candidatus Polarisedimenticolaceae bacterium]